jgi:16S rRNA (guanine966-N2)-methyltransferase
VRNKVRIIGGEWRSRVLNFPNHTDLRPTLDRVRETVFNWLGQDMSGKRCLDLFAGSGAMGFEAASRGAAEVVLVESNRDVLQALKANLQKLGAQQIELMGMDAGKFIDSDHRRFDVIFLDPPYRLGRLGLLPDLLSRLHSHLSMEGLVYLENERAFEPGPDWLTWRRSEAGRAHYQLLKSAVNG